MRVLVRNYNGILDTFIELLKTQNLYTENHHEADCLVTWQDVRGAEKELVEIYQKRLNKPVVVVEHGRGATRDYCEPNKFPLLADKICVWGIKDIKRLRKIGVSEDRMVVTGSPLLARIKPRNLQRPGRNILFVPIVSSKEEPENLLVYAELKKWEYQKVSEVLSEHFNEFKRAWAWKENEYRGVVLKDGTVEQRLWSDDTVNKLPRFLTYNKGFIHVKLTDVHDEHQYLSPIIKTGQGSKDHIDTLVSLLADIDLVVCLEDGTIQLLAYAMGIPVILCDIFRYGRYGGVDNYDRVEKIISPAAYVCGLERLPYFMDYCFSHLNEKNNQKIQTVNEEMGGDIALKADENILGVVTELVSKRELVPA
mgnify:FL=1